ncbi:plasma membrane ammonium transporter Ato3 [Coccidioides immitis RS]|uniref:Plasma membrane ammonium transporter Ato3 n=3 Tax=Coccidioides immitis TaxID=5501 RepID=A0A0E1S0P4_COCIM|nr:plasma membrane ammonium transporter Ato3 [Coccidioides immitis RS]EAS36812.2 plasma membrane ammonium transporter Ato3 [Coccidioides immitis RS]KMU75142.1 hypothetical protein CISG_04429 [Coccidioides immitis RMSCC 3703]TPX25129.1 hypothetical protein DIZ76_010578 [Coccidioides immitis]DAA06464.1 TPA_inf: GPR1/FUN34/YaaH-class plasma membrane protein [Coccidioides immitis]
MPSTPVSTDKDDLNEINFEPIRRTQTAESVIIPRDVFEKLYLNPHQQPHADTLRKTFANPTPVALIGFLVATTPNACAAMGWSGAGRNSGAILSVLIFFGGFLQLLGGLGNWILGNTFSSTLFLTFGMFWLVQGTNLIPFFAVGSTYSPTGNPLEGQKTASFNATTGFFFVFLTLLTVFFLICSLRTNICLFLGLLFLVVAFACFAGTYFELALNHVASAERLQVVGGAFTFGLCVLVWYLLLAEMLETVDLPISLPIGDLSSRIPVKSQRGQRVPKEEC